MVQIFTQDIQTLLKKKIYFKFILSHIIQYTFYLLYNLILIRLEIQIIDYDL